MKPRVARRDIDGILLLDKPAGVSSNQALQSAKRLLQARKAGHTGSLDPIATGLLPLCFGEATKLSQFLLDADKRYWAICRLGVTTTTLDIEGDVLETRPVSVSRESVTRALDAFRGEIEQTPPMYSALKRNGTPLYELARAGIEVARESRRVCISEIKLLRFEGNDLEVEISCSKGTYIRVLAGELGERLGCGAHVAALRRLAVGSLNLERAVTLEALERMDVNDRLRYLIPGDQLLIDIPDVHLTSLATHYLLQGQPVSVRHGVDTGWVRLYDAENRFIGMGHILDDGRVAPRRLMAQGV